MKCPRTGTELKTIEIEGIKVEISEACGGVWFDNYELQKFDEVHEKGGEILIELMEQYRSDSIDLSKPINCPHDTDIVMTRHYFSPLRQIEIDQCPMCGGVWLDAGELARIRELFPREENREEASEKLVQEAAEASGLTEMLIESEERKVKARQIANMFRWLCPSAYIPGKQDGAAF